MTVGFLLRMLLKAWLLPPGGLVLLIFAGGWIRRRRPWAGALMVHTGLALLVVLSLPVVADRLAEWASVARPLDVRRVPRADFIVVLSGGVRANTNAPDGAELRGATLARLAEGAALSRQRRLPLVLSGGSVDGGPSEARAMEQVLERDFGLHAVYLEETSRTTHENALETARWARAVGFTRALLVTSEVHMGRAEREFEAAGLQVVAAPVPGPSGPPSGVSGWLPSPVALQQSHSVLHEWVGNGAERLSRIF